MVDSPEVYSIGNRSRDHERKYAIHDGLGHWTYTMDKQFAMEAARDGKEVLTLRRTNLAT